MYIILLIAVLGRVVDNVFIGYFVRLEPNNNILILFATCMAHKCFF